MTDLTGTRVIVTGGARGLGLAITSALAGAGASVLAVDIDDEPLQELPEQVVGLAVDVTTESGVREVMRTCDHEFGGIDVLINNAGINLLTADRTDSPRQPCAFWELGPVTVSRFFEVHVLAPFLLARAAAAPMLEQGFGRLVTVTTSLPRMIRGLGAPYGPMKAASEAFTGTMAKDLEGSPVTANVLIPGGPVATRFVGTVGPEHRATMMDPEVMGPPALWLASKDSQDSNGMRVIANRWDTELPPAAAAARASEPIAFIVPI